MVAAFSLYGQAGEQINERRLARALEKLFTLDHRLALRPLGVLAKVDREALEVALARLLTNGPVE